MTFRKLLLSATLVLGSTLCAHGQLGVYGTFSAERLSSVACSATTIPCASADHVDRVLGGGGGVYYNFMRIGPARIGADVRADIMSGNKSASLPLAGTNVVRMNSVLGGARASFSLRKNLLHPYVQVSAGWNRRVNPQPYTSPSFFAYRLYGGLDIALLPVMDVRLPEVGVGQNIGFNGVASNPVQSVSVGVVFHMPR